MNVKYHLLILLFFFIAKVAVAQEKELENYTLHLPGSGLKIEMVAIPAGIYTMGSPENEVNRYEDEGPAYKVKIESFWMSKYEITWGLYNLFLNRSIDEFAAVTKANDVDIDVDAVSGATIPYVDMSLGMGTDENFPVGNVTHFAASKFCKWLSAITGHFYRLPTEAEWEYGARAGSTTAYFFGDQVEELGAYAWYHENSNNSYHKVGQKKPNPWGLYDMYGNVAEWTLDQYLPTAYKTRESVTEAPLEIPLAEYPRSVRGGSYYDASEYLRSAARLGSRENWKMRDPQFPKSRWWNTDAPFVGFRIVRVQNPPKETEFKKYWGE